MIWFIFFRTKIANDDKELELKLDKKIENFKRIQNIDHDRFMKDYIGKNWVIM